MSRWNDKPEDRRRMTRMVIEGLLANRPKGVTGIYVTNYGLTWSRRTNSEKYPDNLVLLSEMEQIVEEILEEERVLVED